VGGRPTDADPGAVARPRRRDARHAGRGGETYQYSYNVWQGVAYSAAVGFISSLLGIGGGVVHVRS